jgi:hypothetical protein
MFDNFEEVLQDTALEKWETRMQNVAPADQTMEHFNQAIEECLLEHVAPLAKNCMIKHVKEFGRPIYAKPQDHATRMETLVCCTNRLPGTEPNVTPQQTKNMIFGSFPVKWKQNWICAGKSLVTNTLAEQVQFMANEQSFADNKDKGKKKDGKGDKTKESYRNGGRGKGGRKRQDRKGGRGGCGGNHPDNKHSKKGPDPEDECPVHGGHLWRKCNQNPRGDDYDPARGGGRDGQGRGNTNPGCGDYVRGGGRGGHNNNNNNNNNNHGNNHGNNHHHLDGALDIWVLSWMISLSGTAVRMKLGTTLAAEPKCQKSKYFTLLGTYPGSPLLGKMPGLAVVEGASRRRRWWCCHKALSVPAPEWSMVGQIHPCCHQHLVVPQVD